MARDEIAHLCDEAIEVCVGGSRDGEIATADIVDGLIVDHKRAVGVLKSRVRCQNRIVRLNNRRRHLHLQCISITLSPK